MPVPVPVRLCAVPAPVQLPVPVQSPVRAVAVCPPRSLIYPVAPSHNKERHSLGVCSCAGCRVLPGGNKHAANFVASLLLMLTAGPQS
jgi:hypothetical protein